MTWLTLCTLAGIIFAIPSFGQTVVEPKDGFKETLRESAKISGGHVVGVLGVSSNTRQHLDLHTLVSLDAQQQDICVSFTSADGLYESRNTYTLVAPEDQEVTDPAGPVPLHTLGHRTEYQEELMDLGADRMAVLTTPGPCDQPGQQGYLISFWEQRPSEQPVAIRVLINSRRAQEVMLYHSEQDEIFPCERITEAAHVAFDAVCTLPSRLLTTKRTELELYTVKNRSANPPISLSLIIGAGS